MYYKDFLEQFKDDPTVYAELKRNLDEAFAFWHKSRIYYGVDVGFTAAYGEPIEFIKQEDS